jgi:hypothetical protein
MISTVLVVVAVMSLEAFAQESPPEMAALPGDNPDTSGPEDNAVGMSRALWAVESLTFQSHYPDGFEFTAQIASSAGPVARGQVIWSLAPGTQYRRPAEVDGQTGILRAVWETSASETVPPWVGITYTWQVSDSEGNTFETDPVTVEYEDHSRGWRRSESEDVIVFSEELPAEINQMTIGAMAAQRETYRAAWGGLLPYKPRAILFGSQSAWLEWQQSDIGLGSGVVGTTRREWGATVQVGGGDLTDMAYGTLPHEIAHLYQYEYVGFLAVNWFAEGNATFFELSQPYDYEAGVRQMATNGALPPLLQGTGPSIRGLNPRQGYDIGYTFFKWLADTYGLDAHRQLMANIRGGMTRNAAIEAVTGLPIEEVESRWRRWLGASSLVPTLVPTLTFQFLPSPTPFIFGK